MSAAKPFDIPKKLVVAAFRAVKDSAGGAGIDKETIGQFESKLKVYKPGLDLTVSVWMGGRVCVAAVVRQRSFSPLQSALRQGRFASAFCRSTTVPDVAGFD